MYQIHWQFIDGSAKGTSVTFESLTEAHQYCEIQNKASKKVRYWYSKCG